ncbi:DUF3592 domain-containing protein [Streptomyces sp. NBC_00190]|uniref:DUF3592 domain-containing protein n=1 Tax=unclassified Streptomyces TaxID=2593676 RepID=UPI002E2B5DB7|nr:DUF3592 domain-containing protein [Streptomyces sp. NBC_00190]WSZ38218.1 DUF3592 domain-containing protein [Streptomyces sp. NBC_00868]
MVRASIGLLCGAAGLICLVVGLRAVARKVRTHRALSTGLLAEGRVLQTYVVPGDQGRAGVRRAAVVFRSADGREFLLDDRSGRPRAVNDRVLVRYPQARPQHAVLDDVPRRVAGPAVVICCGTVFVAACLFAAVQTL